MAGSQGQLKVEGKKRQTPKSEVLEKKGKRSKSFVVAGFFLIVVFLSPSHVKNHGVLARLSLFPSSAGRARGQWQFARALGRVTHAGTWGHPKAGELQAPFKPCWRGADQELLPSIGQTAQCWWREQDGAGTGWREAPAKHQNLHT